MHNLGKSKILNVSLTKDAYEKIMEKSKEVNLAKGSYVKILLINGLNNCKKEDMFIQLSGEKIVKLADEYITIRVPEKIYNEMKKISLNTRVSMPQLGRYFVEKELEKEAGKE